jgi:hypothetical protein
MAERKYVKTVDLIYNEFLKSHKSEIDPQAFMNIYSWYGIPVLPQLVILGAETSLGDKTGDPNQGGPLVDVYNYGCMRYSDGDAKSSQWGKLSNGKMLVNGKYWYTFPTSDIGMQAFGRYLKLGPSSNPGFYKKVLTTDPIDWRLFCETYYGKKVTGFEKYLADLITMYERFKARAASFGFIW